MCDVKRYKAMINTPESVIVADVYLSEDFDRVQAENRELQARLTVQDQRVDELVSAGSEMLRIAAISNQGSDAYNRAIVNLHDALSTASPVIINQTAGNPQ